MFLKQAKIIIKYYIYDVHMWNFALCYSVIIFYSAYINISLRIVEFNGIRDILNSIVVVCIDVYLDT